MSKQVFGLSLAFLMVFLISFGSATIAFTGMPTTISQNSTSFSFNVTSDKNETVDLTASNVANARDSTVIVISLDKSSVNLDDSNGRVATVTVTVTPDSTFDFKYDEYSTTVKASGNVSTNVLSSAVKFARTNFKCSDGTCDTSYLNIDDFEFDVSEGIGDEDDGYYPFDTMRIDFTIENNGNDDLQDIDLFLCVYDKTSGKCVFDEDDFEISDNSFDIDEDDDLDVTATLVLDIDSLKAGHNDYTLLLTTKGKIDSSDKTIDGKYTYDFFTKDFEIITNEDFIIVSKFELLNPSVSCGNMITLTGKVWNVGETDFDDDEVYLNVWSTDFNFDDVISFENGLDSFESNVFQYSFTVPKGLVDNKSYVVHFDVYEDEKLATKYLYENGQETTAQYTYRVKVNSGCTIMKPVVTAKLLSDSIVGKEVLIDVSIVNTESSVNTYSVSVKGLNSSIANLVSLSSESVTIPAGSSSIVTVKLEPVSDGVLDFELELKDSVANVFTQPVSVNIESKKKFEFSFNNELFLYGLVGCLGVFIILLLVLVIVNARKKRK